MSDPKVYESVWDALYDDPAEAERMKKWSNDKMNTANIEKTLDTIDKYFNNVWHHIDCADSEPVLCELFEELYGPDIWDKLDKLAIDKDNGIPFEPPQLLTEQLDSDTIYEINPKGTPPVKSCQYCDVDDTDWRGIETSYLVKVCGFCKDGGQDW